MSRQPGGEGGDIHVTIYRFDPSTDAAPRYEQYSAPRTKYMRIIDVLEYLTEVKGIGIAYRSSCGIKKCGTCGVMANGVPKLACYEAAQDGMTIEPLRNFRVIRDLVTDRAPYQEKIDSITPFLVRDSQPGKFPEDLRHSQMIERNRFDQCITCLLCVAACPIMESNPSFVGPAAATRAAALLEDVRDAGAEARLDTLADEFGLWRCHMIGECTEVCPAHAEPALAIQRLRRRSVKRTLRAMVRRVGGGHRP
ncbi:MAG: 2Fe-2S iron-sulfur cluster-binding protein [Thaumarchaeota archaeon]|nr:2Fe-2S iron-sulfur cluster-binding protein [Nitrososphaerota archaeon]